MQPSHVSLWLRTPEWTNARQTRLLLRIDGKRHDHHDGYTRKTPHTTHLEPALLLWSERRLALK